MATYTVYKRQNKNGFSWQYDIKDKSFKNGKKRKSGFKTKGEAVHAAQKIIQDLNNGNFMDDITFEEYYEKWLKANNKEKLSTKQSYWYRRSKALFIAHFGADMVMSRVTRSEYQLFINNYADGRTTSSVKKVHNCISGCFKDALYDGYVKKDPTYKIKYIGTTPAQKEDEKFMTIDQYIAVKDYLKTKHELSYIILFLLAITGARFSEINRMTYDDLNYSTGVIHIPGTKTENADRYVEVSNKDVLLIKEHLLMSPRRTDGKLFNLSHTAVNKAFKNIKKKFKIPEYITPYALRHTHASFLISKGIPIEYISKRLGHANIHMTLTIYTHLLDEHKKEQGQKVRELFSDTDLTLTQ
ncbi:tyrosine-type recombinase/integrase [Macrococcoides caseolyticum]|uniref:tyrosine-type recombinase/integrase n=1 Tax=Macrococcoides caseolyticum TaxID=69966 RepID=UPI001F3718F6|nr:site-specific integrase [Macrococcus caseolyticus]MCE4957681.1 tyrosine-type recombinase/integrase [Macrococcus caseolyticus]